MCTNRCAPPDVHQHLFLVPSFLMPSDQAVPHSEIFHSFKSTTSITLVRVSAVSFILWTRKGDPEKSLWHTVGRRVDSGMTNPKLHP